MQEDYQNELWTSSRNHGDNQQNQLTLVLGDDGIVGDDGSTNRGLLPQIHGGFQIMPSISFKGL